MTGSTKVHQNLYVFIRVYPRAKDEEKWSSWYPVCTHRCIAMVYHWRTPVNRLSSLMKHHTRFDDVYDRKDLFPCDRMCIVITLVESRWLKQPRNDGSELLSCIFGNHCRRLKFHAQILQIIGQLITLHEIKL